MGGDQLSAPALLPQSTTFSPGLSSPKLKGLPVPAIGLDRSSWESIKPLFLTVEDSQPIYGLYESSETRVGFVCNN
jgi:hypothetical protein